MCSDVTDHWLPWKLHCGSVKTHLHRCYVSCVERTRKMERGEGMKRREMMKGR